MAYQQDDNYIVDLATPPLNYQPSYPYHAVEVRSDGKPYRHKWRQSFRTWIEAETAVELVARMGTPMAAVDTLTGKYQVFGIRPD
jgi:hypothetical protein